jgi:hypothetical protein
MLLNIKEIYGHKLAALDGDIGHVSDFYFDDETWVIRYLVADTGSWLPGRLVLVSPHAFAELDRQTNKLHLRLNKKRIENSPPLSSLEPLSRGYEDEYYQYYGWPTYWSGGALWGITGYPLVPLPETATAETRPAYQRKDQRLQHTRAVEGYQIETVDGTIGHVKSFLVDDTSWAICALVVETGHWFAGKEIQISPWKVDRISYAESKVYVSLSKEDIQKTHDHELAKAGAGMGA